MTTSAVSRNSENYVVIRGSEETMKKYYHLPLSSDFDDFEQNEKWMMKWVTCVNRPGCLETSASCTCFSTEGELVMV